MKAPGLEVSDKKIMKVAILKPIFWLRELLMQPIGTILTILVGDHPGAIYVQFCQIPISGSREEVVWTIP